MKKRVVHIGMKFKLKNHIHWKDLEDWIVVGKQYESDKNRPDKDCLSWMCRPDYLPYQKIDWAYGFMANTILINQISE